MTPAAAATIRATITSRSERVDEPTRRAGPFPRGHRSARMTTHEDVGHVALAAAPASAKASVWRRAAPPLVALFALLVRLPLLSTPRFQDDYDQLAMIEGKYPSQPGPFDLYDFINDSNRSALMDRGILPWWSHPSMQLRFFRPLSSALLWSDHRAFGGHILFEHLHSLLWWSAACVGVFTLLKTLFSPRVAGFGLLAFAVAPCHGYPLAWLANREELVSVVFGTFALLAYSRWRERRAARDGLASFALFAMAMLAGEYTLCFAGYVAALELTRPRERVAHKALGVLPFAVPVLAYLAIRHSLHYGAVGTGFYHDPLRDFDGYASVLPRRFAVLFATGWVGVDDRLWVNEAGWKLGLLTATAIAVLAIPIRRVLGELDTDARRRALWLLVGIDPRARARHRGRPLGAIARDPPRRGIGPRWARPRSRLVPVAPASAPRRRRMDGPRGAGARVHSPRPRAAQLLAHAARLQTPRHQFRAPDGVAPRSRRRQVDGDRRAGQPLSNDVRRAPHARRDDPRSRPQLRVRPFPSPANGTQRDRARGGPQSALSGGAERAREQLRRAAVPRRDGRRSPECERRSSRCATTGSRDVCASTSSGTSTTRPFSGSSRRTAGSRRRSSRPPASAKPLRM